MSNYVAAREIHGGHIYFQSNIDGSPRWTKIISEAMKFNSEKEALENSDETGVYSGSITAVKVQS